MHRSQHHVLHDVPVHKTHVLLYHSHSPLGGHEPRLLNSRLVCFERLSPTIVSSNQIGLSVSLVQSDAFDRVNHVFVIPHQSISSNRIFSRARKRTKE